jgi:hypothetical protein
VCVCVYVCMYVCTFSECVCVCVRLLCASEYVIFLRFDIH